MSKELIQAEHDECKLLAEKYGDRYYTMFGELIYQGMDIRTAIWYCYNKLEGGKHGGK